MALKLLFSAWFSGKMEQIVPFSCYEVLFLLMDFTPSFLILPNRILPFDFFIFLQGFPGFLAGIS